MEQLPYKILTGHRRDGALLFSMNEKYLYVKKKHHKSTGKEDWICYQEILCKSDSNAMPCTSRVLVDPKTGSCTHKQIAHTYHPNHELILKDLISRNKIVDDVITLRELCENLSIDIPVGNIFTRELARYILKIIEIFPLYTRQLYYSFF